MTIQSMHCDALPQPTLWGEFHEWNLGAVPTDLFLRIARLVGGPQGSPDQRYPHGIRETAADTMIHIKEEFHDDWSVTVHVGGALDRDSMPVLTAVCDRLIQSERQLSLDLTDLFHICREGVQYLVHVHPRVAFVNVPEFVKRSFDSQGQGGNRGAC
jgi:hypothetical protein